MDADPLPGALPSPRRAGPAVPAGRRRLGDTAARRHESRCQGVRGGAARQRRRADPVGDGRRGRRAAGSPARQSVRRRGRGGRARRGPGDAPRRAPGAHVDSPGPGAIERRARLGGPFPDGGGRGERSGARQRPFSCRAHPTGAHPLAGRPPGGGPVPRLRRDTDAARRRSGDRGALRGRTPAVTPGVGDAAPGRHDRVGTGAGRPLRPRQRAGADVCGEPRL